MEIVFVRNDVYSCDVGISTISKHLEYIHIYIYIYIHTPRVYGPRGLFYHLFEALVLVAWAHLGFEKKRT